MRADSEGPLRPRRAGPLGATRSFCPLLGSCAAAIPPRDLVRCPWLRSILSCSRNRQEGVLNAPHLPTECRGCRLRSGRVVEVVDGLVTPSFLVSPAFFALGDRGEEA